MQYFIDEEFIDDGKTIELISIGIVAEDGREYYGQSSLFDLIAANSWVKENVFPHLRLCPSTDNPDASVEYDYYEHPHGRCRLDSSKCSWRSLAEIRDEIIAFMDIEKYGYPELIGWCCAYDYVAFCQLFGTMMDVPRFIPHSMKDLQYLLDEYGITDDMLPKQEGTAHNALEDAKYIRQLWESLTRYEADMQENTQVRTHTQS